MKSLYIDGTESNWSKSQSVTLFENAHAFQRGDVNHDGMVNISDVTALIDSLLSGVGGCEICGDVNADGLLNISDVTALIDSLLVGTWPEN